MNIDYTVTALMFPAIPLTISIYSNRFHTLSSLIRKLHDEYIFEKHIPSEWEKQLINLNGRIKLLRYSIVFAIFFIREIQLSTKALKLHLSDMKIDLD
jgi:hypothetical protein